MNTAKYSSSIMTRLVIILVFIAVSVLGAKGQGQIILTEGGYCKGTEATLSLGASIPPVSSVQWTAQFGADILSTSGRTARVRWHSTGSSAEVTANFVLQSGGNGSASTDIITLKTASTVTVSISATATFICPGTMVRFTATPANQGSSPVYQWKKNGVNVGTNSTIYDATNLANQDVVTLTLTSSDACASPKTVSSNAITISTKTVEDLSVAVSGQTTLCGNSGAQFSATVSPSDVSVSYRWTRNEEDIEMEATASTQTFTPSSNFVLSNGDRIACRVTVTNSNGHCFSSNTKTSNTLTLSIQQPVTPAITGISVSSPVICSGDQLTLNASFTNGGSNPQFQWTVDGNIVPGNTSSLTIPFYREGMTDINGQPGRNTTVSVSMTSNASCLTSPSSVSYTLPESSITVHPLPQVPGSQHSIVYNCTTATLTALSWGNSGYENYWVNAPNSISMSNPASSSFTVSNGGQYYLRSRSSFNCWSDASATINVNALGIRPQNPSVNPSYMHVEKLPIPQITATPIEANSVARWYDVPASGTPIGPDGNQFSPVMAGTIKRIFYAAAVSTSNQCESLERTNITVELSSDIYGNYIRVKTILINGQQDETNFANLNASQLQQTTTYFDGLGRQEQTVSKQNSPALHDIVVPKGYDQFGRETKHYLPYTSGSDGKFKFDALQDPNTTSTSELEKYQSGKQFAFYQTGGLIPNDERPYGEVLLESCPLNRTLKQSAPGQSWQLNTDPNSINDKTIKSKHHFNTLDDAIIQFEFNSMNSQLTIPSPVTYYAPNQLLANKTLDEHNNQIIEFVDKQGRTLLKRVMNGSLRVDTYYIYDDYGNLAIVLPPEAVKALGY
jgi:hypothetical protein